MNNHIVDDITIKWKQSIVHRPWSIVVQRTSMKNFDPKYNSIPKTEIHCHLEGSIPPKLAVALAEMAMAGGIGATIETLPAGPAHAVLFGEDQARYLVTVPAGSAEAVRAEIAAAGVPVSSTEPRMLLGR